jgi:hypothetical protein
MRIMVFKVPYEGITCSGVSINYKNKCPENPKYFDPPENPGWRQTLKVGILCGFVDIGSAKEYYCKDCMNHLWMEMKMKFDTNLWAFH